MKRSDPSQRCFTYVYKNTKSKFNIRVSIVYYKLMQSKWELIKSNEKEQI